MPSQVFVFVVVVVLLLLLILLALLAAQFQIPPPLSSIKSVKPATQTIGSKFRTARPPPYLRMYSTAAALLFLVLAYPYNRTCDADVPAHCLDDEGRNAMEQIYQGLSTQHRLVTSWRNEHLDASIGLGCKCY